MLTNTRQVLDDIDRELAQRRRAVQIARAALEIPIEKNRSAAKIVFVAGVLGAFFGRPFSRRAPKTDDPVPPPSEDELARGTE